MSDLERTRGELRETIGGEKRVLAGMDTSAAAAEAAEDTQDILARLEPDVQQYLRLRLASAVLREGIKHYRKKNEAPQPGKRPLPAADARLLRGLADRVRRRSRRAGPGRRAAQRQDGRAHRDERRDLRSALPGPALASLEIWLKRGEPMPFIVDDILVSFDNPRAVATLKILAELSTQTQVIFFAHHEHLVIFGHAVHVRRGAVRASAVGRV